MFLVGRRPLVAVVTVKAAKEEVWWSKEWKGHGEKHKEEVWDGQLGQVSTGVSSRRRLVMSREKENVNSELF